MQTNAISSDIDLVRHCIDGDAAAWQQLYNKHHLRLLSIIRSRMAGKSVDDEWIQEIASLVWFSLVEKDHDRLRRFEPRRCRQFSAYLSALARQEILKLYRKDHRRRLREASAARSELVRSLESPAHIEERLTEFLTTLTRQERAFCVSSLLNQSAAGHESPYSAANTWTLRHRILCKLDVFMRV